MARDYIEDRFEQRESKKKLEDLSKLARGREDVAAEEDIVGNAEKVEPLKGASPIGRNDPCSCGSGKKYKKCCGRAG